MPFRILPTQAPRTVADIDKLCWLTVIGCENGHSASLTGPELIARFPAEAVIGDIAERLVCSVCGSKEGSIGFIQERSERARRKMARETPGLPGVYKR